MAKKKRAVPAVSHTPRSARKWLDYSDIGMAALLVCAVLLAYAPAFNGALLWDDDGHVTKPELQSFHGLWRIWFDLGATQQYYPLLHSAFWLEHRLWGDAVFGYHLTNVLLHALAALLVVAVVRRLGLRGAWLAAFIFALHPVCVEAVAWISEQKSTLSTVFYLSAALVYLNFDRTRRRSLYFLAFGLFVCALLSKTVTATLPAALLVVFWWERKRLGFRRDVLPLTPWFVSGIAAGLFTAWVERRFIGADGSDFALTIAQRLLLPGRVIWFYLWKLIWPVGLTFIYPRWTVDASTWWQYLFPIGVLGMAAGLIVFSRRHRGPLAGFLFFAGTLFPALGFFNVYPFIYSFVADHFQYLASLGVIVPAAYGLTLVAERWSNRASVAVVLVLAALTWRQTGIYKDAPALYQATLERNPDCWMAHNNLGSILSKIPGRLPDAIAEYEAALRLRPNYPEAHNNLGNALIDMPGRLPDAIKHFTAALPIKGNQAVVHNNLGLALSRTPGRLKDAIAEYEMAVRMKPDLVEARYNLANALLEAGEPVDAIEQLEAAAQLSPNSAAIHNNLGIALSRVPARAPEAVSEYEAALRLQPDYVEAQYNLGVVLIQIPDRVQDGIGHLEEALRIKPDYLEAHYSLGIALLKVPGRTPDAIAQLEAVLRLRPDLEPVRQMLSRLKAT
jgi:tetratricopeptide (TPR) repeat protein